jgi:hypothetical protein
VLLYVEIRNNIEVGFFYLKDKVEKQVNSWIEGDYECQRIISIIAGEIW